MTCKSVSTFLCHIIWPSPMKSHVTVNRNNICRTGCFRKNVFHFHFFIFKLLAAIQTDDRLNIWSFSMNDLTTMCKESSHFFIRCTLVEWEPVTGCLMIDTKLYTTKSTQILCDRNNMIICKLWIDRHGKKDILTMSADITHICKWFIIQCTI